MKWDFLIGKTRSEDFLLDESMVWNEDGDVINYHFISPSSLLSLVHKVGYDLLDKFLPLNMTSIVLETCARHVRPVRAGDKVVIGVRVIGVDENKVKFRGIVMFRDEKILETEFTRIIVSKNYLRRVSIEKTEKVLGLPRIL